MITNKDMMFLITDRLPEEGKPRAKPTAEAVCELANNRYHEILRNMMPEKNQFSPQCFESRKAQSRALVHLAKAAFKALHVELLELFGREDTVSMRLVTNRSMPMTPDVLSIKMGASSGNRYELIKSERNRWATHHHGYRSWN